MPVRSATATDDAIISLRIFGREIKVSFVEGGIFYGGNIASEYLPIEGLKEDFQFTLSIVDGEGALQFNNGQIITWESSPVSGTGISRGDYTSKRSSDFRLHISELRISSLN